MEIEQLFAQRSENIQPSAIRQLFKLLQTPDIISFAGGWPDPALFPNDEIAEIAREVAHNEAATALQYGTTIGDSRLRAALRQRLQRALGIETAEDELMIISGSQQGIYLAAALFVNPGEVVAVEAPTFLGAFGPIKTFEGELIGVGMDDEGLDVDALERLCQQRPVKIVYTIPDFQNPSGRTMSIERRHRLIALADQYQFVIVEDAPYSELRYSGEPMPPIYSLDKNNNTLFLGSFSKIFTPMRVGWLCAPAAVVAKLVAAKMAVDVSTSGYIQAIAYHFIERGSLDKHIGRLQASYGTKRIAMLAALDRNMPAGVEWTTPDGGMFIWVTLPEHVDATSLFHQAIEENIAFVIGSAFYPDSDAAPQNTLRLNFITPSVEEIHEGIGRFGRVLAQALDSVTIP